MKILSILTFYYPHWTGLTAHAVAIAEGLAARGHEVTVLTTRYSHELVRDEVVNGVRVVRLQPAGRITRALVSPAFPWAAARLIAEHDVVQIHTPLSEAPLVALLCRSLGRPLLMTHHGDLIMPAGVVNKLVERVAFPLLSYTGKFANAATSYSQDYADHSALLQSFRQKLHYVYPPVELPAPDLGASAAWRRELGLDGTTLVGIAGRWVEEKGFDFLLEAMPLVRQQFPNAHLIYAGERQVVYEDFYERCLPQIEAQSQHITFLGLIRDPQKMANFYAMCELFALPSRSDMMALVQVEAMLAGTPVVASDIPGARVVVRETGFGKLTPPRDPQALAKTIIEVLGDRERYAPTVAGVREVFSTEQTMRKYEQIMEKIVATSAGKSRRAASAQRGARAALQALGASVVGPLAASPTGATAPTHGGLSADDHARLDTLLKNEADMAFARRARTLLDYLDLKDGEKVLDCGCGMGVYMMMMNRLRDVEIYGVDGDVARLDWAEREGVEARLSSVDIHHLPFADNTFDKVLMSEVLEHIADDRKAMREVFRVLKPGGILALSVPHADYPFQWDPINKTLEALDMQPIREPGLVTGLWSNHWRLYRPDELRSVIGETGFEIVALEEQTHYSFPFIHFIVYSIGKPLIEYNLLPKNLRNSADRFRGEQNSGSMFNPINLGVKLFRRFDARNDHLRGDEQTFVNLVAKARKPL